MRIVLEYNVLYVSLIAAVWISLLLLVRVFLGTRIHRMFFSLSWLIVLIRLILPISVVVPVSHMRGAGVVYDYLRELKVPGLIWFWLAGVCITASVFVVRYIICGRYLREALPIQNVPDIDEEIFTFMGIRVYVSDRISSPVTFGIFRQKVLLPGYYMRLSREQLKYILIHEKIHINYHDNLNKFLVILAVSLHWFNPFAWLMYLCYNRDIELACDEKVIRQVGESGREEYANVLISLASREVMGQSVYSGFAGSAIKERIVMIMKYRAMKSWNYMLYVLLAMVLTFIFAVPVKVEEKAPVPPQASEPEEPVYDSVDVYKILEEDSSGTKANVIVKTKEGVKLCFKIYIRKEFASTNGGIFTSYLSEGEKWRAGMDEKYAGEITIPEAVTFKGRQYPVKSIGAYSFYKCKKVSKIRIPDTVREIKEKAFYHCQSLRELRLPAELELMDVNPFIGCTALEKFEMPESRGQYQVKDGILYTDYGRFLKVCPQGKKKKHLKVGDDVVQIASYAFYETKIEKVTLPESVVRVKRRCFRNSDTLKHVRACESTRFSEDAFEGSEQVKVERYGK